MGNKVNNVNELAAVRVDERLDPRARLLVLDLNDVRQDGSVVGLDDVFERDRVVVVLSVNDTLRLGNGLLRRQLGNRGSDRRCGANK